MKLYAHGSLLGTYLPSTPEKLANADYIIGHEFASRVNPDELGSANEAIAEFIVERYSHLPIVAAQRVASAIHLLKPRLELAGVFEGPSSNTVASEGGSWGELKQAVDVMGGKEMKPIIASHARHAPRVVLQAHKMGVDAILPPYLPKDFDENSEQWWCRGSLRWAARELIGVPELLRRRQIKF
jgi:hypothetical protein